MIVEKPPAYLIVQRDECKQKDMEKVGSDFEPRSIGTKPRIPASV